ncbi:unnamed protein product [Boreogadus saida]
MEPTTSVLAGAVPCAGLREAAVWLRAAHRVEDLHFLPDLPVALCQSTLLQSDNLCVGGSTQGACQHLNAVPRVLG